MRIIDHLKAFKSFHRYDGDVGIEIETETLRKYTIPEFSFWTTHPDGSLRDFGVEYVLKQPLKVKGEVRTALEEFRDKTAKIKFKEDSVTTSVHVHLNVLNEKVRTFGNFLTLYTLFENLLIRFSGPDRLSNLFCLPICDAEENYKVLVQALRNLSQYGSWKSLVFAENASKYAALNLSSFARYGSLEVRSFRGTTDIDVINEWVNILHSIMEYSRQDIFPQDIMDKVRSNPVTLMKEVFGQYYKSLSRKDELDLIKRNIFYASSIAYSIKSWGQFDTTENVNHKPTTKELDHVSVKLLGKLFKDCDPGEKEFAYQTAINNWLVKNGMAPAQPEVNMAPIQWEPRLGGRQVNNGAIIDEAGADRAAQAFDALARRARNRIVEGEL